MLEHFYKKLDVLRELSLLCTRLILAYGFLNSVIRNLKNIDSVVCWFKRICIPFPVLNAYLVTGIEIFGVGLLVLGLFSRIVSILLIGIMVVAIVTFHWGNGFDASENGFEIPLYYCIMLFGLIAFGSGKISLDYFLFKKRNKGWEI
jgi:putative oxidoreductase